METIKIGDKIIPVVPQKHARLRHRLKPGDLQSILSREYSHQSYRVLSILVPLLPETVPEWEWDGFPTEDVWGAYQDGNEDAFDEDNIPASSPDVDQIVAAFEKALTVNGAGRLGKLLSLIETGAKLSVEQRTQEQSTLDLEQSPGPNGASASQTTGASPQTETANME